MLRGPWTARRSSQSILKEINPEYSLEGLILKFQYLGHLMQRADLLEKTLMVGKILKGFLEVLEKHGVTQISAKGEPFNPQKHEAFAQVESTDHEPNTVVAELHKGYFMADRLLRPSLVSVAKLPETKEENSEQTKIEKNETDD